MKENKDREKYEAPCTKRTRVGLESGVCATSIDPENPNDSNGQIEGHTVNQDFDFKFEDQTWDNVGQQ